MRAGRVHAGHQRTARRRTGIAGRVILREPRPRIGELVDIRRLVEIAAEAAQVCPTEIIDQKEHDVQRSFGHRGTRRASRKEANRERRTSNEARHSTCNTVHVSRSGHVASNRRGGREGQDT